MAAPWIEVLDRLEFGAGPTGLLVFDVEPDWIRSNTYDNTIQRPYIRRQKPRTGALWQEPAFSFQDAGSGAAGSAPRHDPFLLSTGVLAKSISADTSVTYTWDGLIPTNFAAVTPVNLYIGNGLKFSATDCCFNLGWEFRPDAPPIIRANGWGRYVAPTEAAGSAALGTSAVPVVCKGLTATVASDTLVLREVDFMLNIESNSPNLNMAGTNGVDAPDVVNSTPTCRLLFEIPPASTQAYWTDLTSENGLAVSIVVGAAAGNIATYTWTVYQNAHPVVTNVNGIYHLELTGNMGYGSGEPFKIIYT